MASVVLKMDYIVAGIRPFSGFIDYMDRDLAKENEDLELSYFGFIDYMDRKSSKGSGLFSMDKESLTPEEIGDIKKLFDENQDKGGVLWRFTFSFKEGFLEQLGIAGDGIVHEDILKNIIHKSMSASLKKGEFRDSLWLAEIHHNTENTHIHVALIDPSLERCEGYIPGIHRVAKSTMINELMYYDDPRIKDRQQRINDIIRERIINKRREGGLSLSSKTNLELYQDIHKALPEDKRLWNYHMNALKDVKPLIDEYTKKYLEEHRGVDIDELMGAITNQVDVQEKYYGRESKEPNFYAEHKIADMYGRLGNILLKEIKKLDKSVQSENSGKVLLAKISKRHYEKSMAEVNKMMDIESKSYLNSLAYYEYKSKVK